MAIQNIKFIPIYYTNNSDKIYLKQMDYLDGIWLTGGAINENFVKIQNQTIDPNQYESFKISSNALYTNVVKEILEKTK